jgi:hypothetical protein
LSYDFHGEGQTHYKQHTEHPITSGFPLDIWWISSKQGLVCHSYSYVLQRINFGYFFVGYPPWGSKNMHLSLQSMAQNYTNLESPENKLTFHLGKYNSKWNRKGSKSSNLAMPDDDFLNINHIWCIPAMALIMYKGNLINCEHWWFIGPNPQHHKFSIPSFVQSGYEEIYLQQHTQFINVTSNGYVYVAHFSEEFSIPYEQISCRYKIA